MKVLIIFAAVLAFAYASNEESYDDQPYGYGKGNGYGYGNGYGHAHGYGYGHGHGYGYGVYPDQRNALRQKYVNKIAEKNGAGIGTADEQGVPGTFLAKNNPTHGYPGYAGAAHAHANYNRGYGFGGYAYGGNGYPAAH